MAKYVLHGGETKFECRANTDFYQYIADCIPEGGLYVACNFARSSKAREQEVFEGDLHKFSKILKGKSVKTTLATEETLTNLLKQADVLYISGGDHVDHLRDLIKTIPGALEALMRVPVVVGSSAGMMVLCRDYITEDRKVKTGLGIIPYGAVVHHHAADGIYNYQEHNRIPPLLMVHETQFVVVEL